MFLLIYFCTILFYKCSFLFTLENFALQMFLSIYILQFCLTNAFSYLHCTILIHKHPPDLHCWVFSTNVSPYLHCRILLYKCSSVFTVHCTICFTNVHFIYIVQFCYTNVHPLLLCTICFTVIPPYFHCTILLYRCSCLFTWHNFPRNTYCGTLIYQYRTTYIA